MRGGMAAAETGERPNAGRIRTGEVVAAWQRPDPAGGRVVTYAGWPLYTYVTDTAPGTATGQALNLNGGLWYALAPSGQVIHKKAGGGSGSGY